MKPTHEKSTTELVDEGINLFRSRIPEEHGVATTKLESIFFISQVTETDCFFNIVFVKLFRTFIVIWFYSKVQVASN